MATYESLGDLICDVADILQPPERLSVSEAAAKYRYVNNPGSYVGPWLNSMAPMMVEPMNEFTARQYRGLVFVGPAQSGKTDSLCINTLAYSVKVDPMDLMLVCPTMVDGRDFSMRRVDRLHKHSPEIGEMLLPTADADNKFDKQYRNGVLFTIGWPTESQLAGKPIPRMILTDRDRMPDDVEGAGEGFDLAMARTRSFGSYGKVVAESSPSREVDPSIMWVRRTAHEAPPAKGILALYNRGDRRRWYWPCPKCNGYFEGNFKHLNYERREGQTNLEVAETTRMQCPHCDHKIHPDDREDMNFWGQWVKDGQGIDEIGRVFGPEPRTMIASFWQNGVAAVFTNWKTLVATYLDAMDDFERTGSEDALRKFYNNDLGEPYYRKSLENLRLPEVLKSRAERVPETEVRKVPHGVRFLVALIDVQKNMWVVQVFGILPGRPFDSVVIDRFDVRKSKRTDGDGDAAWVKPHTYVEDWDELIDHVIEKEYELADGSGRFMQIKVTGCDSGGKEGVTTKAYEFYRSLVAKNKHRRFILLKGDPKPGNPRARIAYPDSSRKDVKSGARGDIPVLMFNSNLLKDELNGRLESLVPGQGMFRFPDWLGDNFYAELCAEIRTDKGWEDPTGKRRNEAWDLAYYMVGLCVSEMVRVESIDWQNPPTWAAEWDKNDLVRQAAAPSRFALAQQGGYDFAEFGKSLG
jgi:phage terminase large subunit GpA-like protein